MSIILIVILMTDSALVFVNTVSWLPHFEKKRGLKKLNGMK